MQRIATNLVRPRLIELNILELSAHWRTISSCTNAWKDWIERHKQPHHILWWLGWGNYWYLISFLFHDNIVNTLCSLKMNEIPHAFNELIFIDSFFSVWMESKKEVGQLGWIGISLPQEHFCPSWRKKKNKPLAIFLPQKIGW